MREVWKPIPETGGRIEISSRARLRKVRTPTGKSIDPPRLKKPSKNDDGYLVVAWRANGKQRRLSLHGCLLRAFLGPAPSPKHHSLIRDGNKSNITLANVLWGTDTERNQLRKVNGTWPGRPSRIIKGERCYCCTKCGGWQPRGAFYAMGRKKGSACCIRPECKRCDSELAAGRRLRRKARFAVAA
jgi:hypothetical protein